MLTGRYTWECSAWDNGAMLDPDYRTFAEHLSDHGYATCAVGKMHLTGPRWMGGFDYRPYGDLRCGEFPFHQPDPPETFDGRWNKHSVGRFPFAGATRIPESLLVDTVTTREALSFVREHECAHPETPWLLQVGYSRPHFPLTAPGRFVTRALANPSTLPELPDGYPEALHPHDRFIVEDFHLTEFATETQQHARACYYACVDFVDQCIGELLDGLRADSSLENTYVIYTSDHGDMVGEHGLWWKRTYYEASARVPLLVSGPGLGAGTSNDVPVELVDLFPTLCDMAGIDAPAELPGDSVLPLCGRDPESPPANRTATRGKRTARCDFVNGNPAMMFRMLRSGSYKLVEFPDPPSLLFNLETDPGETSNLLPAEGGHGPGSAEPERVEPMARILKDAPDWSDVRDMKDRDMARWAHHRSSEPTAPAQYALDDGRIVDADRFLYQGL